MLSALCVSRTLGLGRLLLVLGVLLGCALAWPDDAPLSAEVKLEAAKSLAAANRHREALAAYEELLVLLGPKPVLLAGAARSALALQAYERAARYVGRALQGTDKAFLESTLGKELTALSGEAGKKMKHEANIRRKFIPSFVAKVLKALPQETTKIPEKYLLQNREDFLHNLQEKYRSRHLSVVLWCLRKGKLGSGRMSERYRDQALAERRFETIVKFIRKQKKNWEKHYREQSRDRPVPLAELEGEASKEVGGRTWAMRSAIFSWDPSTRGSALSTWSAKVTIWAPEEKIEGDTADVPWCEVKTEVNSRFFFDP